jgi:g-D-glutamyl-meso-diaminopimelate peptidase
MRHLTIRTLAAFTAAFLLAVQAPVSSMTALAGPASDPTLTSRTGSGPAATGPGSGTSNAGTAPAADASNQPNYYDQVSGSIVTPCDRYSYDYMVNDLNRMAQTYPSLVTVRTYGTSVDGRALYEAVVGNANAPKKILFQASIHGREYMSTTILMKELDALLEGAANGGTYQGTALSTLLNSVCLCVVPMANPDGVSISQFGEDGLKTDSLKEQLRSIYAQDNANGTAGDYATYLTRWKANANGVDLNHNFDASWAQVSGPSHPSSQNYKDTAPLSQPESKGLAKLVTDTKFDAVISYHCMGDIIYWDTANNQKSTPSREMAQLVNSVSGYAISASLGTGGFKDWLQQRGTNPTAGITIEFGRSASPVNFGEFNTLYSQTKSFVPLLMTYVKDH